MNSTDERFVLQTARPRGAAAQGEGRRRLRRGALLMAVVGAWLMAGSAAADVALGAAADADGANERMEWSLSEAYEAAMENSSDIRDAELALEDARLALQHVRSTGLMAPDPVAELQAEAEVELAQRNVALARDRVRLQVAEDFLGVVRLENLIAVAKEGHELARRQMAIAEDRFAVGAAARIDIIRAANQVSMTEANVLELQGNRDIALMALRRTLGLDLQAPVYPVVEQVEPAPFEADLARDLAFALENRLEILRARTGVETARKQIELADNDYTPALVLARAQVGLQRAQEGLEQAQKGIELEVRQLYQSLQDAKRRLDVLKRTEEEAREELRITEEMYEAGVSTSVEVLRAQTRLTQARTDYVNTLFDYQIAQVRYAHATARTMAEHDE